jgi:hypothetical protein
MVEVGEQVELEQKWFWRAIEKHAGARGLRFGEDSGGSAYLLADFSTEASKQELRRLLIEQGGEEWADQSLSLAVSMASGGRGKDHVVAPTVPTK